MHILVYISDFIVPFIILSIVIYGLLAGVNVYDTFIKGARSGFLTVIRLMPTLIGLMAAVGILRASGFLDFLASLIGQFSSHIGFPGELIPLSIVKMFSSSAATGLLLDIYKNFGTDSRLGQIASISMCCTDYAKIWGRITDGGVLMASVTFEHLTKTYPNGFVSVDDVNLHIEDGEFVVFHGPSGCGKSTLLRMTGGLEDITSGEIYLGTDLLNDILPRDRRLAMAFQNYTLYRHMNVYDNMALGLRLRDLPRTVIDSRVKTAADFFGISGILTKKIRTISDAERQRVALGRAVVCQPKVLLVDEDFARQDDGRRREMLEDIVRINRELKITVLYVTNKYEEAVSLDARVIFMKDGRITDDRHFHQTDET